MSCTRLSARGAAQPTATFTFPSSSRIIPSLASVTGRISS